MYSFLMKKAGFWFARKQEVPDKQKESIEKDDTISKNLTEVINTLKNETLESNDIIIREILIGRVQHVKGAVVFIDGMAKADIINDDIIKPLLFKAVFENVETENDDSFIYYISNSVIPANEVELVDSMSSAINGFLNGDVVLFIDGMAKAMIINSKGWEKRSVTEPAVAVVRGPRESFVENLGQIHP